jgi:hypothetical protein
MPGVYRAPMRARDLDVPPGAGAEYGLSDTTWLARGLTQGDVPPAAAQTFARGGRNFQRTHDDEAERMSAETWRRVQAIDHR